MGRLRNAYLPVLACLLLACSTALGATDISGGYYEDGTTPFPSRDSDFNLTGDAWFGWQAGTITGSLNLNQYNFQMQTGGGNVTTFSGPLSGTGDFNWYGGGAGNWQTTPSFLSGTVANTLSGTFTLEQGTLALDKSAGVTAIAGPLIIGGGANQAILQLDHSNQINDNVPITLAGAYTSSIVTQGHSETAGSLNLQTNGVLDLGSGSGTLKFGGSNSQAWKSGKSLSVENYTAGSSHLYFGSNSNALTSTQLSQVSFVNPSGKATGVYSAALQSNGEVVPTNTPWVTPATPSTSPDFKIVPYPKSLQELPGTLSLGTTNHIVVGSPSLTPLGNVLSNEIFALTGKRLAVTGGTPASGDISLQLNSGLSGEAYTMNVQNQAVISGGNYQAVSEGTVTLLQSLKSSGNTLSLQKVQINDAPAASFRATMIDLAREPISIATIEKQIELNRLYKIPYLQLHLSDDQAFTVQISSVTGINGHNYTGADDHQVMPTYTKQQLTDLENFANARGVTIIPEIEMPGHGGQLVTARPDLFSTGWYHGSTLNIANPDAITALQSIVSEVAGIFKSSPYFHIGGDEADFSQLNYGYVNYINGNPDPTVTPTARAQWDAKMDQLTTQLRASGDIGPTDKVTSAIEVYRDFLNHMDDYVKSLGKKMIAWEGFGPSGQVPVNKDIIVDSFENTYYRPDQLTADGYQDINASWSPLYVVSMQNDADRTVHLAATLQQLYAWDKQHYDVYYGNVTPTSGIYVPDANANMILGGEMAAWENTDAVLIDSLRLRLAAMGEKLWDPDAPWTFDDFYSRLTSTDAMLDKLFLANSMPIPEPGSMTILAMGGAFMLRRRRKARC